VRDYIYVEDVINAYLLVASGKKQETGAIYNVGSGVQTTLREVVQVAQKVLNISKEPLWGTMKQRMWDTNTWVANSQKLQNKFEWHAGYTFEQGFRKMVDWFVANPQFLA